MIKNWDRTNNGRLMRIEPPLPNMDNHLDNGENEREEQVTPIENTQNAPKRATAQENYVVRTQVLAQLPTYHGMESENPYTCIKDFQVLCLTTK